MVFSNESLNRTIRDMIQASNPGVVAIRAQQNGPLPTGKPFATVLISILPPLGWAERILTNNVTEDIDELMTERLKVRGSINFYRASSDSYTDVNIVSPLDEAVKFRLFAQSNAAQDILDTAEMGINHISDVRNLTTVVNDTWEERAQLDFDFFVLSTRSDVIFEIKQVLVAGSYQHDENEHPVSVLIDGNSG